MTPSLSSLTNKIDLPEGQEVVVTILVQTDRETFQRSAGQWKGTLDAEALIRDICAERDRDRLPSESPE
jgi:predicted DNA-binding antitoxin AbrB/MazE fold protein